uniref:lymphocyte function-associated antigen 3-like n=1 Tax=Semicossyphus pulcher TaxID=241346 RepID=UPI0037E78E61
MEKQGDFWLLAVVLLAVVNISAAEDKAVYFKVGGELGLRPTFSGRITSILWKLKADLMAEWVEGVVPLVYYGRFKTRTTLNTTSGHLVLKDTTKDDEGLYTMEINNVVQNERFLAKAIEEVPAPTVELQPLICNADMESCELTCHLPTKEAEPITYSWKEGDGEWEQKKKDIEITKTETARVKTYSCKMTNPVSEKESKPKDNPFFQDDPVPNHGVVVGVLIALVVAFVVTVAGCGFWKKKEIKGWYIKKRGNNVSETDNGHIASSSGGASPTPEDVPLKGEA